MFKKEYNDELNNIKASEQFKKDTISLMQAKQKELEEKDNKTIKFAPKRYGRLVASVAILLVAAGIYGLTQNNFISMDTAETESIYDQIIEQNTTDELKDSETDNNRFNADINGTCKRAFTINDVQPLKSTENKADIEKILFNTEVEGGMGYEGLMFPDISEYESKNPFNITDEFTSLPVYKYIPLSVEDAENIYFDTLADLGLTKDAIHYIEYEWAKMIKVEKGDKDYITNNTDCVIAETKVFESNQPPYENSKIYMINSEFDLGYISIFPSRGIVNLYLYDDVPEDINQLTLNNYVTEKYFDNSVNSYILNDYNIYGEQNYILHYIFKETDNYEENIFNHSVGNTIVWHTDSLWQAKNDKGENIHFQYIADECYASSKELPAINWQQALYRLYNGEYISSVPYEITEQSTVARIELVYKEPPCFLPGLKKEGYAVPFYKFYVPIGQRETDKGNLIDYGIYYVSAIHPDYIELTDNYAQFN